MEFKKIIYECKKNQNHIIFSLISTYLIISLFYVGIMNFLIQIIGIYLPIINIYSNISKEQKKYMNWCIYLINSLILNYVFSNLNVLITLLGNYSFYLNLFHLVLLYLQYSFKDTLYDAFLNANEYNSLSKTILVFNKNTFNEYKKLLGVMFLEYQSIIKNLEIKSKINNFKKYLEEQFNYQEEIVKDKTN